MTSLHALVGEERSLQEVSRAIYLTVRPMRAPVVGALLVTCSDETEGECADVFQQQFVQNLLPQLKFSRRAPFRTANLGGRYEWGSLRLAEQHFAAPVDESAGKVLIVKINAHVGVEQPGDRLSRNETPPTLGERNRYGRVLPCCGALNALLAGVSSPFVDELRELFRSEDEDRLTVLQNVEQVPAARAPLYAAILSARLQARKAVMDAQDQVPDSPTLFIVLPAVTINRPERDTEMLCGVYAIDRRTAETTSSYTGLGDDPSAYAMRVVHQRITISDDQIGRSREARDHRAMIRTAIRTASDAGRSRVAADPRLARLREDVERNQHRQHHHARALLRAALPIMAEVAPVPAALVAFGDGALGIHHAFRVHRLAESMKGDAEARQLLQDLHDRIDTMDADRAAALVELLARDYA